MARTAEEQLITADTSTTIKSFLKNTENLASKRDISDNVIFFEIITVTLPLVKLT